MLFLISASEPELVAYCNIVINNLSSLLETIPQILVATPARLAPFLDKISLDIDTFVIDEADLILSYGYEDEGIIYALF